MRFSRLPLAVPLLRRCVTPRPRGDDTDDFLKPDNWQGRADLLKLDPKARTIVGETMEDPKYNTFLCTKKKYGDFELSFKVQLRDGSATAACRSAATLRKDDKKFVRRAARRWTSARATGAASTARASAG